MDPVLTYVTGISHIGVAVADITEARRQYMLLGFVSLHEGVERVESHGVCTVMMENHGYVVELVTPLEEGTPSPVDAYLGKTYAMYHVCYTVSDLDAQIQLLRQNRFVMVDEPKPSAALGGKRTVFLFNRKLGMIELAEE